MDCSENLVFLEHVVFLLNHLPRRIEDLVPFLDPHSLEVDLTSGFISYLVPERFQFSLKLHQNHLLCLNL